MAVLSASELATELDTDSRTVRKFLRSVTPKDSHPGKGARWNIEKKNLRSLRTQFAKWNAAQAEKVAADEKPAENEVIIVDNSPGQPTS